MTETTQTDSSFKPFKFILFLFIFFNYFCCSVNNKEARHEVESETSKRKHGKPSKNAKKEREWTMSACIKPNHQHTSTKIS